MTWNSVQPLFSGVLGGLVVALVNIGTTWLREKRKLEVERNNLLSLIRAEIALNEQSFKMFLDGEVDLKYLIDFSQPTRASWDGSHIRLAQLIEARDMQKLIGYYAIVGTVRGTISAATKSEQDMGPLMSRAAEILHENSKHAYDAFQNYLGAAPIGR